MKPHLLLFGVFLSATRRHSREWTSADGRKLQADFVSATATHVTLKIAGKDTSVPLKRDKDCEYTEYRTGDTAL